LRVTLMVEALTPQLSGIGRYSWELAQRLPLHPEIEAVHYRLPGRWIDNPEDLVLGRSQPSYWYRALRNWQGRHTLAGSIVHGPNYFLPAEAETGIITVHDLSVFTFPDTHPAARIAQFERQFSNSINKAAHIITDTATMRDEFIAFSGIAADKVSVAPLGVSESYHPRTPEALHLLLDRYGLTPGYGLCISTLEPRKKIDCLLRSWSALPHGVRRQHPLVLAGPKGWLNDQLYEQINQAQAAGWLHFLHFVPESDLPGLYAGAGLFVYPSIYEGFGLPPVEAMASGIPTIVADHSSLPEVCGDAALRVEPDDHILFTEALMRGFNDNEWREIAIERGLKRAAQYTWPRCVDETVAIYHKI
jgi:alpha-1,3-rhamnosyl/mannosyltransferase